MRCEVVAVGTELLLGQVLDTNSAHIADRLALAGIDCVFRTTVGDNEERISQVVGIALERNDAVLVSGGLGPTPDDVTREGLARALCVPLVRDPAMAANIRAIFESRRREMPESNARQADRPEGATFIAQVRGTAPGLICERDGRVVYAVPGVPNEMEEMLERAVVPDLIRRSGAKAVILSRLLRTWGLSESALAERVASRVDNQTNPTIAFLAQGIEGVNLRVTAKADDVPAARRLLDEEEAELRGLLGDFVFGVDDQRMERVIAKLLTERGMTAGVAESLTSGLVGARLAETEGASHWFRGSIVAYDSQVKFDLLGVPEGPVVSEDAAAAMAIGVRRVLGSDVGLALTGVAGPTEQDGMPVGTLCVGIALGDRVVTRTMRLPGQRDQMRQMSVITALDLLRRELLDV